MAKRPPVRAAACVFDAYGTLFDVAGSARAARDELGERWPALAELWRSRQLQYTWLRSLTGQHADFWQVTGDALDFALASLGIENRALRARLMEAYLRLEAFPEVPAVLARLQEGGMRLAILSNGTPKMLAAAVDAAGLDGRFEAVISVEEAGVFKPHPDVYQLAPARLGLPREQICFLSSNGWDAWSAKAFGFRVLWCNRYSQPPERLPAQPDGEINDLTELPPLVLNV